MDFARRCTMHETDILAQAVLAQAGEAKHTPGPWVYYNTGATQHGSPVYTLTSLALSPASVHDGIWLADIRMGRPEEEVRIFEGRSNARLMAAAPDLLTACVNVLKFLNDDEAEGIKKAIIKAGGELP
jgi:hypothetical protein